MYSYKYYITSVNYDMTRYDAAMHATHAAETRRRKRVESGQMELFS